jgi:hypothetical protein
MFQKIYLNHVNRNQGTRIEIGVEYVNESDAEYTMKHEHVGGDFALTRVNKTIFVEYFVFDDALNYGNIYFEMDKIQEQIINELAEPLRNKWEKERIAKKIVGLDE